MAGLKVRSRHIGIRVITRFQLEKSVHVLVELYEHAVIVYTVVKDTQSECGQPRHRFQKSLFWSAYTETQPQSFQTKTGSAAFSKVSVFDLENAGVV